MSVPGEQQKQALIVAASALATSRLGTERRASLQRFLAQFYAHASAADLAGRAPEDLFGAAFSLWQFAELRPPGKAKVRVFDPHDAAPGWTSAGMVVEIVNDDMPFLVDSVGMALNAEDVAVHLLIHPILRVTRDGTGHLAALHDPNVEGGNAESFMQVEIGELRDSARAEAIATRLETVLAEIRAAVGDWRKMRDSLAELHQEMTLRKPPVDEAELAETLDFLIWLDDDNFIYLGCREHRFDLSSQDGVAAGLGILADPSYRIFDGLRNFAALPPDVQAFLRAPRLLFISKSNRRAEIHRPVRMDTIGVKVFDEKGEAVGMRLFVGLFTSQAYSRPARSIPFLRRKVTGVLARSGFELNSHDGRVLAHILETFPRDELFQISENELYGIATGILGLQARQRIALFVRRDPFGRFVSCLVHVPRDRYDVSLRRRFAAVLEQAYGAKVDSYNLLVGDDALARIHFILGAKGALPEVDLEEVERLLVEVGRSWTDRLTDALIAAQGEDQGLDAAKRYGAGFPTDYRERYTVAAAVADIEHLENVHRGRSLALSLYHPLEAEAGELRLKIYHEGAPCALADILPMLEHLGLKAITEIPFEITVAGAAPSVWIQDFGLISSLGDIDVAAAHARFEDAFAQIWTGATESDGFNRLVLAAGLDERQVTMLRLYAKVQRQVGSAFSQAYMEDALAHYPALAARLVALFDARFDPAVSAHATAETERRVKEIEVELDAVESLDEDRILRSFLRLIEKSLRTNYFQRLPDGTPKPYLSVKMSGREIDLFPLPRPLCEIYVYSPRVEGVHLRAGKVARGGIRWSDRKEDFRTEILGLMKAQVVKNAVIVPTGSKGGFVVKRMPAERERQQEEVVECYKTLMRGMLDLTDNIVGGRIVPPPDVVRHDGDDPYLVVAADKGTATFSDIANAVADEYGYWLGDAYAAGGSTGYDHKAMGITARGAWELVKRHFRELDIDIQAADFTCVGVGDMAGDVFGNGMLRSRHTRLVAAFNHLHIFLDPDPDPKKSLAERKRLFDLPRSSWTDYDKSLLSKGGGIYDRRAKSIPLSPEIRARLGVADEHLAPSALIRAILKAPVDLLFFGGIGTFVKGSDEIHAEAGDRANDALRIDGREIRARVVGEGANLGVTQRGRIEYAMAGGRIDTDAIDNSAGVNTSDHEVNLKILLNAVMASGEIKVAERNALLQQMTDAVAGLVLRDNYLQGLALSLAEAQGAVRLDGEARLMRELERGGRLDRAVEFLPDDAALAVRARARQPLTRPELSVLLAYVKTTLTEDLLASDFPDDPQLETDLFAYFPKILIPRFRRAMEGHRLRRELIATVASNDLINRTGLTFAHEIGARTGRPLGDVARAYMIVRQIFYLDALWEDVDALDNKVKAGTQIELLRPALRLAERATAWFLMGGTLDISAQTGAYQPGVTALATHLSEILPDSHKAQLGHRIRSFTAHGVPAALAARAARLDFLLSSIDIVRLGLSTNGDPVTLARQFFAVGARIGLDTLRAVARRLPSDTEWQRLAAAALIEDLYAHQAALTARAADGNADFAKWLDGHARDLARIQALRHEIEGALQPDLAMLTVADRALRRLLADNA